MLHNLRLGDDSELTSNRGVTLQPVKKDSDFIQSKAHVGGKADEKHAIYSVGRVASLTSDTLGQYATAKLSRPCRKGPGPDMLRC